LKNKYKYITTNITLQLILYYFKIEKESRKFFDHGSPVLANKNQVLPNINQVKKNKNQVLPYKNQVLPYKNQVKENNKLKKIKIFNVY
jgi:hypothetical protein